MSALSNGYTFNTDEAKLRKFSLHFDEIQLTAKLFSRLTFVVYGLANSLWDPMLKQITIVSVDCTIRIIIS